MKAQSNVATIQNVQFQSQLRSYSPFAVYSDLETISLKDQALTTESVEKIVGWALSHHFMHCSERSSSEAKLTIYSERYGINILQQTQNVTKSLKKTLKGCGC